MFKSINCRECGGKMRKTTKSSGNVLGIIIALIALAIGVSLTITGVGAIIGIPLCICALFMGGKRTKIMACKTCGYYYPCA